VGVALTVAVRKPDVVQAPPTVVSVYVERAPPAAIASEGSQVTVIASPAPSASTQTPPFASAAAQRRPDDISEERALLDPARTALGRSDGSSALAGVKKHEQRFPKGQLTEEREAIAIQALVALGRGDEARARGERFKRTYPNSVLAPSVNAALDAIPK
jgi:TolA-binding protein